MKEQPLVTVITITRNRAELISRCIKSIQQQTYNNIEHIIVDGASTDNTESVVESLNDGRIKYIKLSENLNIHDTYDVGLKNGTGKYVCLLDDDDEYLSTKIEKQVALIESLPQDYGFVYCWMAYYDNKSKKLLAEHKPSVRGYVLEEVVEKPVVSGTPTFFYKYEVFNELFHDVRDTGLSSDWATGAKSCEKWKVDFVPEILINVYVNHGSVRMSDDSKYYQDYESRRIKLSKYFLSTYHEIFEKYPKKSIPHLKSIAISYFNIGEYKNAWPYYSKLLRLDFSIKNLMHPIVCFLKRIIK